MSRTELRDELDAALKTALEQDDQTAIAIVRLILAALKERDESARAEGQIDGLSDQDLIAMMQIMAEHRQDSIRRYEESGQLDLAAREAEEIEVIERFLPPRMDDESCSQAVREVIAELGASKLKDIGRVMTELKSRYAGRMDFAEARRRICEQLG
jgi:uncharacterized protein YqeY